MCIKCCATIPCNDWTNNSYKPITNTVWVRARLCKLQKGCTRLAAARYTIPVAYPWSVVLSNVGCLKKGIFFSCQTFFFVSFDWFIDFLVFNATFSNISAMSWRPVLVVEETEVPGENHRPWVSNWSSMNFNFLWY
jgi:hypothetical protein